MEGPLACGLPAADAELEAAGLATAEPLAGADAAGLEAAGALAGATELAATGLAEATALGGGGLELAGAAAPPPHAASNALAISRPTDRTPAPSNRVEPTAMKTSPPCDTLRLRIPARPYP